ncbi:MAG: SRPBCC family protein [Chloroflexi bacterium]|nr:SRPBCC family protein [Chloroflexota bacterium]
MRNEETVTIDRPIDEVFAYLSDVERRPEWVSSVLNTKQTSDGPIGLGATFSQEGKTFGKHVEVTWEITAYEPPHTIQQRMQYGPARMVMTATLEATNGGTTVTFVQEGETGGLLRLNDPLVARSLKKQLAADLATLKTLIESGVAPA